MSQMHIIETYFECCGFDHTMLQGGTSVYLWNLSRAFAREGHRVSMVSPAHGRLDDLRGRHEVEDLPYEDVHTLPLVLDPRVWQGFEETAYLDLRTTAHRIRKEGVDLYLLSNEYLDRLPDSFYPPYSAKGRDLTFLKPLVFQADCVRFLRAWFEDERAIVHMHEPYYHYLLPAALRDDPTKQVVSTVQSNMPITKKVHAPQVHRLLEALDAPLPAGADGEGDPEGEPGTGGSRGTGGDLAAMSQYQQRTHLHYEYPRDHVGVYELVAEHADLVDFLSPGQRDFYTTFRDTPFERLFRELDVYGTVRRNARKGFVGGCAISDTWLADHGDEADREGVLDGLGLDPNLPTFFHNARYAVEHKGQRELLRAVDRVLGDGLSANFVLRCVSPVGIDDPLFHEVERRWPDRVRIQSARAEEGAVRAYAAAADFCVFPSKFEMDTFLIAQGEAMAHGAVPVATDQCGTSHFHHASPEPLTTGLSVPRSFAEDDDLLVAALAERLREAAELLEKDPERYGELSARSAAVARRFTWEDCARRHLEAFASLWRGERPVLKAQDALRWGWFDLLPEHAWTEHREEIAEAALELGDPEVYARCAPVDGGAARRLFRSAWRRADFASCERLLRGHGGHVPAEEADLLRSRHGSGGDDGAVYRFAHALRVEMVVPGADVDGERAAARVVPLTRIGAGEFSLPQAPGEDGTSASAMLLLTLDSGRSAWDTVRHG